MLKGIEIKNFQSHKHTQMKFNPGVNVILGATDAGKSAIFRSMLWALYNRPLGRGFISSWSSSCSVKLVFDDCNILRSVDSKNNIYKLNDQIFKAIGRNPPEEILAAHNISRDLNIQAQIDPFFLLQNSSGDVAKYLNRVASLDIIDSTIHNLHSAYRRTNKEVTQGHVFLVELKDEHDSYSYLDDVQTLIKKAKIIETKLLELKDNIKQVSKICKEIYDVKNKISDYRIKVAYKEDVITALDIAGNINSFVDKIDKIETIIDEIDEIETDIKEIETSGISLELIDNAIHIDTQIIDLIQKKKGIQEFLNSIAKNQERILTQKQELLELKEDWETNKPEICPLCGAEYEN
jgi:DNA repair exonuclease SbcCD ATPase subunit